MVFLNKNTYILFTMIWKIDQIKIVKLWIISHFDIYYINYNSDRLIRSYDHYINNINIRLYISDDYRAGQDRIGQGKVRSLYPENLGIKFSNFHH